MDNQTCPKCKAETLTVTVGDVGDQLPPRPGDRVKWFGARVRFACTNCKHDQTGILEVPEDLAEKARGTVIGDGPVRLKGP